MCKVWSVDNLVCCRSRLHVLDIWDMSDWVALVCKTLVNPLLDQNVAMSRVGPGASTWQSVQGRSLTLHSWGFLRSILRKQGHILIALICIHQMSKNWESILKCSFYVTLHDLKLLVLKYPWKNPLVDGDGEVKSYHKEQPVQAVVYYHFRNFKICSSWLCLYFVSMNFTKIVSVNGFR